MKKIKLFPAPHLEIRIYVSDEMVKDLTECRAMAQCEDPDARGKACGNCSWNDVEFQGTGMCELPETRKQLLESNT